MGRGRGKAGGSLKHGEVLGSVGYTSMNGKSNMENE